MGRETVEHVLDPTDQRNHLATKKDREREGSREWAVGSWAHTDASEEPGQHRVYLFPSPTGGTDVDGHREASVTDPDPHRFGPRTPGDPTELVRTTVGASEVGAREREP